jgi:DNA polymerase-1
VTGRRRPARTVWVDFEFVARPGFRPDVVCCAFKVDDAPTRVLWRDQLGPTPPYRIDDDTTVVSFTQAEWSCHLALGWKLPKHVIDLNCELRMLSNGLKLPAGQSLIGFCRWLGLDAGDAAVKDAVRNRIIKGWPFSPEEQDLILKYASSDVDILALLFDRIEPRLDYDRALYRGDWSWVSAMMEHRGVPLNGPLFRRIADPTTWNAMRDALVPELDKAGIYVPDNDGSYHFSLDRFDAYLRAEGIPWPRTEDGRLSTKTKVFEDMTKGHPQLEGLRQLKHVRDKMRSVELSVGDDDRNRTVLWPYKAKSGRTQPAASQWIFSPAVFLRNLIEPGPGMAISYVDYSSMEFLIAAAKSRDPLMLKLYDNDPYLSFAKHVGAAPPDATKQTHGPLRDRYKTGLLAIQYGVAYVTLAAKLGVSHVAAQAMIDQHHELFSTYWAWAEDWLAWALDHGTMWTHMDWRCAVGDVELKTRSIINWPVQSVGGDILRMACVWATKRGLRLCAPVHDAVLLEAPIDRIDRDVKLLQDIMGRASSLVLGGPRLRTDAKTIRYPNHYSDSRGDEIWAHVTGLIERMGTNAVA